MEPGKAVVDILYLDQLGYYVDYVEWVKERRQGKHIGFVTTVDINLEHKECDGKEITW